jgi:hypothetical protein
MRLSPVERGFGRLAIQTRTSTVSLQASSAGGAAAQVVSRFEDVRPQGQPSENEAEATREGDDTEKRRIDFGHGDRGQPRTRPLVLTSPGSFVHPGDVLRPARRANRAAARATPTARSAPKPQRLDSRSLMNRAGRETAYRPPRTRTRETRQPATAARPRPHICGGLHRTVSAVSRDASPRRRGRRWAPAPRGHRLQASARVLRFRSSYSLSSRTPWLRSSPSFASSSAAETPATACCAASVRVAMRTSDAVTFGRAAM